jgi:membrane peptidoglycan carboxypeptidase
MITDILSKDAINWSRLTIGRPAATKTGTSEEFRDAVVMGYTPNLATGVWMGNADNSAMAEGTFSAQGVGPIWTSFMKAAVDYLGLPPDDFQKPDSVVTSNCAGKSEVFKKDAAPSEPGACRYSGGSAGSPAPSAGSPTPSQSSGPSESPRPSNEPTTTDDPGVTEPPGPTPPPQPTAPPPPTEPPQETAPPPPTGPPQQTDQPQGGGDG